MRESAFFQSVDARQFRKFDAKMQKGSGDHVMEFTLIFEGR